MKCYQITGTYEGAAPFYLWLEDGGDRPQEFREKVEMELDRDFPEFAPHFAEVVKTERGPVVNLFRLSQGELRDLFYETEPMEITGSINVCRFWRLARVESYNIFLSLWKIKDVKGVAFYVVDFIVYPDKRTALSRNGNFREIDEKSIKRNGFYALRGHKRNDSHRPSFQNRAIA